MRVIARLDIKNDTLIKGVQFEGLRRLGSPEAAARAYYEAGIHEILYYDAVASLYRRNSLFHLLQEVSKFVFCPVTLSGGIRSLEDVERALGSGADKVAINTAAIAEPSLIERIANKFGSQCFVLSIEAKRGSTGWECYTDGGREHSHRDAVSWAREAQERGAGEILVTSVDRDGTRKGFDIQLIDAVVDAVRIPVVASGGAGTVAHVKSASAVPHLSGVAIGTMLHYKTATVAELIEAING